MKTYSKLCTEFYDCVQHPNGDQAHVFYMYHAHQAQGAILEPMCGTGRFLIPMLQAGLDAQGFDASSHMLDALKNKYSKISSYQAPVWQQFLQDLDSDKRYQLIFIPYGSLGLITNGQDLKKSLAAMYRHLEDGGKLLLEIETVASVPYPCGLWQRDSYSRVDSSQLALNFITSYWQETQIFQSHSRYESIVNGKVVETEEELFEQYLFRCDELDGLLQTAGFVTIKKYPAYDDAKIVDESTPIIIYECIK